MHITSVALGASALLASSVAIAAPLRFYATASWQHRSLTPADSEGIRSDAVFRAIATCRDSGAQLCEGESTRMLSSSTELESATCEHEASAIAYDGLVDTTSFYDFTAARSATGTPSALLAYSVRGLAFWDATFACKRAGYDVCVHVLDEATTTPLTRDFTLVTGHATVRGYLLLAGVRPFS